MRRALDDTLSNIRQHLPTEAGLALNVAPPKVAKVAKRLTAATQRFEAIPVTKRRRLATRSRREPAVTDEPLTGDGDVVLEQQEQQQERLPEEEHDEKRYFTLRIICAVLHNYIL